MLQKLLTTLAVMGTLSALVGCGAQAAPPPTPEPVVVGAATGKIVLGKISDQPAEEIQDWQPLADYLAAHLGDFGIGVGKVKVAKDLETMADWIASGEVDLVFDNPYSAMYVSDHSGGHFLVRRVKTGEPEKHAVIFTAANSGVNSLADLNGRMIAVEEPESASGFMLPVAYLVEAGLKPTRKASPDLAVAADEVGYVFSLDDDNTVLWVLSGRVVVGSVDGEAFAKFKEENPEALVVLTETESVTRDQPGVVSPKTDPALIEAVNILLLNLAESDGGQAIMPAETVRFAAYSEGEADLGRLREMYDLVKDR